MIFLIQENIFSCYHYEKLINILTNKNYNLDVRIIKVIPFTEDILTDDPRGIPEAGSNVICFGAVKLAHIANKYNWTPGSFYNSNHDFEIYSKYYGKEMLNNDAAIINISDELPEIFNDCIFFARPTGDTKAFAGGHFIKSSWDEFVKNSLANKSEGVSSVNKDTTVMVASLKQIYSEIRCWVIKGKIITASQYVLNGKVIYDHCTEPEVLNYAQKMVDIYQPADAFVLDVCKTPDGLRIVEINCLNCAGFYEADINKLISTLINEFNF